MNDEYLPCMLHFKQCIGLVFQFNEGVKVPRKKHFFPTKCQTKCTGFAYDVLLVFLMVDTTILYPPCVIDLLRRKNT
jgi:hypothetical protein